ncbi:hypothetical protein [Robertmurraya sp. P23]|uniref:hypothetical protein n=1 Tax=Robertmurraya sp. P23 TaxID=3436931 RepID=UPI003D99FBC2
MKNYFKTMKLVKSFVATTVLSFGVISGGHFAAAAGPKVGPDNMVQAQSSPELEEPTHSNAELKAEIQQKKEEKLVKSQGSLHASVKGTPSSQTKPEVPAPTKVERKDEIQQSKEDRMIKSQGSVHASETAKANASLNSVIFSETTSTELNTTDAATEYLFGSDSATSANTNGEDFYLGKLGYGNTVQFDVSSGSGIYFSSERAQNATYVYGYWFLTGIQKAPTGTSPSEWGVHQAKLALETYEAMKSVYGSKVRPVIFIDVELALTGMKDYDYANNRSIYTAFVNYLNQYGQGVKPGTYSSPGNWERTMGDFSPSTPGAYWVAYYPSEIPTDLTTSNPDWLNFPGTNEKAEIWQYYGGYDDYNVAWKLP